MLLPRQTRDRHKGKSALKKAARVFFVQVPPLFNFGAACWYFAQRLTDELEAAGAPALPIGAAARKSNSFFFQISSFLTLCLS